MAQTKQNNYNALKLVQNELQQSLELALQALNAFIDQPEDKDPLRNCMAQLQQVNGTIDILNLAGAELLSTEMSALAKALHDNNCEDTEQAQEVLVHALLLLPNYLQVLSNDVQDHPLSLLETVNQLRSARAEAPLEANSLFKPKLTGVLPDSITPDPHQVLPNIGISNDKVGHAFQLSLLQWLRNEDEQSLRKMRGLIHYLRLSCQQERTTIFWWVAEAVVEALLDKSLQVLPEVKLNLGKLNQPIKILTEENEQQLLALFPKELERNLLLLVARADSNHEHVTQLKDLFGLHFFDSRQKIYGMSNNALSDAHSAVLDQLQTIKEHISQYDHSSNLTADDVTQTAEQLTTMVDTLQMLTEYSASQILQSQVDGLNTLSNTEQSPSEQQLMALADSLLEVESLLQPTSTSESTPEQQQLQETVINECLSELSNIKEALATQAESNNTDNQLLEGTAEQLELIGGSLTMLNLPEASETLEKTAQKMKACVANNEELLPAKLDLFAEIIAACDLFMEGINQHGQPLNQFLDTANTKLANFEQLLGGEAETETSHELPETLAEIGTIGVEAEAAPVENEAALEVEEPAEDEITLEVEEPAETETTLEVEEPAETETTLEVEEPAETETTLEVEEPAETETTLEVEEPAETETTLEVEEPAETETTLEIEEPAEDETTLEVEEPVEEAEQGLQFAEGIDPEIAEIFLEEAGEVSIELAELIPKWREHEDLESLATVRRHFHTLKGSGRMAGAQVIGELSWAVEHMLNTVLEDNQPIPKATGQIVSDAFELLPDLLKRFSHGDMDSPEQVGALTNQANTLLEADAAKTEPSLEVEEPVETEAVLDVDETAETETTLEVEDPAETETTLEVEEPVEAETTLEVEEPAEAETTLEVEEPAETETTLEVEEPAENESVLDVEEPVEAETTLEVEEPVEAETTPEVEEPVETETTLEVEEPVEAETAFEVEEPAETESVLDVDESAEEVTTLETEESGEDEETTLQSIFNNEATQHIEALQQACEHLTESSTVNNEMLRATHSLKGCANIAEVTPIALIADQFDQALQGLYKQNIQLSQKQLDLLSRIVEGLDAVLDSNKSGDVTEPDIRILADNIYFLTAESATVTPSPALIDPEYLVTYLEETDELLDTYTKKLGKLQQDPENIDRRDSVHKTLTKLSENAEQINLLAIAELYQLLDKLILVPDPHAPTLFDLLDQGYEELNNHIESLIQNKAAPELTAFKQNVNDFIGQELSVTTDDEIGESSEVEEVPVSPDEQEKQEAVANDFVMPDIDADLLEAFTEECAELLESSETAIKQWSEDPNNHEASQQLQRDLHTIKGGSRLAGIDPISELTHQTESLVLAVSNDKQAADNQFFDLLQRCQDRLTELQEQLAAQSNLAFANDLIAEITQISSGETPKQEAVEEVSTPTEAAVTTQAKLPPKKAVPPTPSAAPAAHVDQIRVRADLLDYLTNFAGEVSISRDRVSQQNSAIHQQLKEMEDTVSRLQEQLRQLEIETETQILFRYEGEKKDQESEFDPLELDRFSMIQQLSRGLTESVSDLTDISQSMQTLVRGTDSILLQQSRLNTDLQQGLMNTRMLPFKGVTPRLERIVRQTNTELGKQSTLTVYGDDQDLDRTILDRIVAPIEHILRNAIAHGLETPDERKDLGKNETGTLTLTLAREGSEILITLSDDGSGINVEKIKQKALDLELIREDNIPADEELIQFILNSGFSTAEEVSQVSGRGVGMDVVSNEIRALKGRLSIQSEAGKGTTFSIRLPLTLSIIQALLVSSHDQQYAIPLANVHSGERITVKEIQALQTSSAPYYEFNDEKYEFIPLCNLLGQSFNLPTNPAQQLPLLLFRSGDIRLAILVDSINSNREIVIKTVGDQLGSISAINGATILGDGQVVFILDIPTLVETSAEDAHRNVEDANNLALELAELQERTPIAMVVDDSITIRKASSNLLKRLGFEVSTARDGVDALAQLHDKKPDIILLDVEMPRMDGFEFASIVRNDDKFKHLPIIMITSRTGDKHRDRAMGIGVNIYMGKPYQEDELVAAMQKLLGDNYPDDSKP